MSYTVHFEKAPDGEVRLVHVSGDVPLGRHEVSGHYAAGHQESSLSVLHRLPNGSIRQHAASTHVHVTSAPLHEHAHEHTTGGESSL